jgi:hypothetical protein
MQIQLCAATSRHAVMHAATPGERSSASNRLRAELDARDALDTNLAAAARAAMAAAIVQTRSNSLSQPAAADVAADTAAAAAADVALAAVRPAGQPLTEDWECFKGMLEAWVGLDTIFHHVICSQNTG